MDEPDSNLDAEGTMALARAVEEHKKRGGSARAIPLSGKGVTGACSAAHFGEHFVSECQAGPRGAAVDPAAGKSAPVAGTRSRQKNGPGGSAVIVAHRHGAFAQCDTVYLMEGGRPMPATSGRSSAPVRSLRGAEARISGGGSPAGEASRTVRQLPKPAGVPATADRLRAPAREREAGTAGAERKRTDAAARPAVRIVRGGKKGAVAARTAEPRPQGSEGQGERSRSKPAGQTASPDRDFARERRRRIAGAIVRVSGARAPTGGDGGSGACESDGSVRGSDPRTNRDGAS